MSCDLSVTYLFIVNKKEKEIQKKRNIKSRKILVFTCIIKKVLNLWLAPYILFGYLNKRLLRNLLRKILIYISSNQPHLCTVYQSYSLRRKIVHYTFVLTFTVLTASLRRIVIHFHSSLIY